MNNLQLHTCNSQPPTPTATPQPVFNGKLPEIGSAAPQLRYVKNDRTEACLADHKGSVVVVIMFPSVDTGV